MADTVWQLNSYTPKQLLQIILQGFDFLLDNPQKRKKIFIELIRKFRASSDGLFLDSEIPIKRVCNFKQVIYSSAIAHQVASHSSYSAQEIAFKLAGMVSENAQVLLENCVDLRIFPEILQGLVVDVSNSGYLQFEFTDPAIAGWLHAFIDDWKSNARSIHATSSSMASKNAAQVFSIHHAHARCCSLLRLAHDAQWITLSQPDAHPGNWQLLQPNPVSWLTPDLQLHLAHSAERTLIHHLLVGLDDGVRFPRRCATELSQAFQILHRHLQLGGNLQQQPEQYRQVYLALILATQRQLYFLLEDCLKIHAPAEL